MATQAIASWVVALDPYDIPDKVFDAASRSFYNFVGCAIGGGDHPAVTKAYKALKPLFGKPTNPLLWDANEKIDASHAALLHGIASHVHDYDDTHLETIIHPTGPVASAALAYVDHVYELEKIEGKEFLTALVAGIEVECKLGLAVWPTHYDIGWHITSTTGSIGAAVAVGKLMGLGTDALAHAIGVASVQVTGLREMFGSDTKSFHVGRAAQNGLLAALLARGGFTSSLQALEAKRGWANVVVSGGKHKLDHYVAELGRIWETKKNSFKPFPCGIVKHPAIDAAIKFHEQLRNSDDDEPLEGWEIVGELEKMAFLVRVHPLVVELTSKRDPQDGLQAKFSVYHGVAVGLLCGAATPSQYTDEHVKEELVVKIRRSVSIEMDVSIKADEAILTARREGLPDVTVHVQHAVGSLLSPLTDEQLITKFKGQVTHVVKDEARVSQLSQRYWNLIGVRAVGGPGNASLA